MEKSLFNDNPETRKWKVELTINTLSYENGYSTGTSSFIVLINQLPNFGSCNIDPLNGTSASTIFTIKCVDWFDPDGSIVKYNYYGRLFFSKTRLIKIMLIQNLLFKRIS